MSWKTKLRCLQLEAPHSQLQKKGRQVFGLATPWRVTRDGDGQNNGKQGHLSHKEGGRLAGGCSGPPRRVKEGLLWVQRPEVRQCESSVKQTTSHLLPNTHPMAPSSLTWCIKLGAPTIKGQERNVSPSTLQEKRITTESLLTDKCISKRFPPVYPILSFPAPNHRPPTNS